MPPYGSQLYVQPALHGPRRRRGPLNSQGVPYGAPPGAVGTSNEVHYGTGTQGAGVGVVNPHHGVGPTQSPPHQQGFTPFTASDKPPAGTYDPTLDAALDASNRGLSDYIRDFTRDYGAPGSDVPGGRATHDYLLARGNNATTYHRSLSDLIRGYGNLATSQTENANAAGLLGGGFAAQAAAKRAANEGREEGRMTSDFGKQQLALGLGFQRQYTDAASALERAQRENKFFGIDTRAAEFYQAAGTGYEPPTRPGNEHQKHGIVWRDHGKGHVMLPNGRIISKDKLKEMLRRKTHGARGAGGGGYSGGGRGLYPGTPRHSYGAGNLYPGVPRHVYP